MRPLRLPYAHEMRPVRRCQSSFAHGSPVTHKQAMMPPSVRKMDPVHWAWLTDNDDMRVNGAGQAIDKMWIEIPDHYPGMELDAMQIMPSHLYGIIVVHVVGTDPRGRPFSMPGNGRARGPSPTTRSGVTERFKSLTVSTICGGMDPRPRHCLYRYKQRCRFCN